MSPSTQKSLPLAVAEVALAALALTLSSYLMVTVGDTAGLIQYVNEHAPEYGLDPAAVLSAARVEGWSGRIGDGGLTYGPWQDHMTEFTGRGVVTVSTRQCPRW